MIVVFMFSSQNGNQSQSTSDVFTNKIIDFYNISDDNIEEVTRTIVSFIVRKSAHFLIYFIGGFFIYGFFKTYDLPIKNVVYYSILFGFVYAITDELHQYFIPQRAAQIRDVFIDTFGVFLMTVLRCSVDSAGRTREFWQ